jgi:hypothetical protein
LASRFGVANATHITPRRIVRIDDPDGSLRLCAVRVSDGFRYCITRQCRAMCVGMAHRQRRRNKEKRHHFCELTRAPRAALRQTGCCRDHNHNECAGQYKTFADSNNGRWLYSAGFRRFALPKDANQSSDDVNDRKDNQQ